MRIEIVDVKTENKGKWRVASVTYKSDTGRVDAKNVMSFTFKDVFNTLSEAKHGDVFDVTTIKNDKGYWDWTEITAAGKNTGAASATAGVAKAVRSSYETPEERAKRQVYIVRQSSISAAVELAALNKAKGPVTEADIINSAKQFEGYVFDVEPVVQEAEVT